MTFFRLTSVLVISFALTSCGSNYWFGKDKEQNITGERLPVAEKTRDLEIDENLNKSHFSATAIINPTTWNSQVFDSNNSNLLVNLIDSPTKSISYNHSSSFVYPVSPVINEGILYIIEAEGIVKAIDIATSGEVWSNDTIYKEKNSGFANVFKEKFVSGGLKLNENKIYATFGLSKVLCLDSSTGAIIWSTQLSSPIRSIPLVFKDKIIVQSIDHKTFALSETTGEVLWSHFGTPEDLNSLDVAEPALFNDVLVIKHSSNELYFINTESGDELGSSALMPQNSARGLSKSAVLNFTGKVHIDEGSIFTVNNQGYLVKLNAQNGQIEFTKDLKITSDILIVENYIFALSENYRLIAVSKDTGLVKWKTDFSIKNEDGKLDTNLTLTSPIMINGQILLVTNKGKLRLIDPSNGKIVTEKEGYADNVMLKPIVFDGHLVLISDSGTVNIY